MKFKHQLYPYQQDVLNVFKKELDRGDKKIHVVAPPGSGKTIMGLDMISKIEGNHLILVPNITLQYQWKDKIEQFFLEELECIDDIVSTSIDSIKKVNILTYQALTTSSRDNDLIYEKLLDLWFFDVKTEFDSRITFLDYIDMLKDLDLEEYRDKISKYKKKLKASEEDLVEKILSNKVLDYFEKLKHSNIKSIVVDEAHHLTSWWSKVIYFLWEGLGNEASNNFNVNYKSKNIGQGIISEVLKLTDKSKYSKIANFPIIIGLTATPPYDDIDFFTLDDDYSKLLGDVDYYIPTPAVVKSARLAPWSDLVFFVEPGDDLKYILEKTDRKLNNFINDNKDDVIVYIYNYIEKNYDTLLNKSYLKLINYLKFIKKYSDKDISFYYFDKKIGEDLLLEDIAKTIGKYISYIESKKISESNIRLVKDTKKLFYELGYIWRFSNFNKFRTQIENMLVYSKSKINGVKLILDKEIQNLGKDLKCAIITDYLEDRDGIINCKYILKELIKYKELNPVLVSGQGIWKISGEGELEEFNTNILDVTRDLEDGKISLVIGTRGILGEGWDCPKLNTLIDLTGIVAYMSVNQVRGRAIRLDKSNLNKVANIYDIVTYYEGYTKEVDLHRLERKHEKFYGVDDTGLIIRGVDHIYPNIRKYIIDYKKVNENMLKRSTLRSYYYKLWKIGGDYQNKEVFGLDLEVKDIGRFIPFVNFKIYDSFSFFNILGNKNYLQNISGKSYYLELIHRFLNNFIGGIVEAQKNIKNLPKEFNFEILLGDNGNFRLISNYRDELVVKKFILDLNVIFSTVIEQKYILRYPFAYFDGKSVEFKYMNFGLPDVLCRNKKSRFNLFNYIKINYIKTLMLLDGSIFLYIPNVFSQTFRNVSLYKKMYKQSNVDYIYLQRRGIDKQEYIGKKPFIESKIEKIWI